MSEHPPIPNVTRGAGWDELVAACEEQVPLTQAYGRTLEVIAKSLWREWTRGMAIVPLPEPDTTNEISSTWRINKGLGTEIAVTAYINGDDGSPAIDSQDAYGELHMFSPDSLRAHCRAGLAAADRAEQLAAEQAKAVNDA